MSVNEGLWNMLLDVGSIKIVAFDENIKRKLSLIDLEALPKGDRAQAG